MNISRKNIGELTDLLTVEVFPADYSPGVAKALREQTKKIKLPGFRPGMVPEAHVRKLYGRRIFSDEINRLLAASVSDYIRDQKLDLLGEPLVVTDPPPLDLSSSNVALQFQYELGIAPELDLSSLWNQSVNRYTIGMDEELLASRIANLRRAYGKMTTPEVSESGDVLYLELQELLPSGEVSQTGIYKKGSLRTDQLIDRSIHDSFIGRIKEDIGIVNLSQAFHQDYERLAHLLDISPAAAAMVGADFSYRILNIHRLEPSDLDEAFYLKLFPEGEVTSEAAFAQKIRQEIQDRLDELAEVRLETDIIQTAVNHFAAALPEPFLKKWLLSRREERYSPENLDHNYLDFARNLKWALLSQQIAKTNDIKIAATEVFTESKVKLRKQFQLHSQESISEEQLDEYAGKMMQNRDQASQLFEEVRTKKVLSHLKNSLDTHTIEISYADFQKLE